jgi:hypothetical protein
MRRGVICAVKASSDQLLKSEGERVASMCGTVTCVLINLTRGWVLPGGQVALLDGSGGESEAVPRGLVPTGPRLDDMDAGSGCRLPVVTGLIQI